MKILIISQYFYPENFRINDLAVELKKRGHIITILTGLPNYPKGEYFEGYSNKKNNDEIWFKTDNRNLFEFSLNSFLDNRDFHTKNVSLDLHNSDFKNNVMTEYEKKFSEQGMPIYRLEAVYESNDNGGYVYVNK